MSKQAPIFKWPNDLVDHHDLAGDALAAVALLKARKEHFQLDAPRAMVRAVFLTPESRHYNVSIRKTVFLGGLMNLKKIYRFLQARQSANLLSKASIV